MSESGLNAEIAQFITDQVRKADREQILIGFADIDGINEVVDVDTSLPRAISVAIPLKAEVVAGVEHGPSRGYFKEDMALRKILKDLGSALVEYIRDFGYQAEADVPFDVESVVTRNFIHDSYAPNKVIACYSAIGWMGKCGLVVTKPFGTANRLISVFTDAPLACSKEIFLSRCGRCNECITVCKANAISGTDWNPSLIASNLIDMDACMTACEEQSLEAFGERTGLCGTCMYACPYTKAYLKRNGFTS